MKGSVAVLISDRGIGTGLEETVYHRYIVGAASRGERSDTTDRLRIDGGTAIDKQRHTLVVVDYDGLMQGGDVF